MFKKLLVSLISIMKEASVILGKHNQRGSVTMITVSPMTESQKLGEVLSRSQSPFDARASSSPQNKFDKNRANFPKRSQWFG